MLPLKKTLDAINKKNGTHFEEKQGECPIHGNFVGIVFLDSSGMDIHPLSCPKCVVHEQRMEVAEDIMKQQSGRASFAADLCGIPEIYRESNLSEQPFSAADYKIVKKIFSTPNMIQSPIQIWVQGGDDNLRSLAVTSMAMEVIRKSVLSNSRPSVLYLSLDLAQISWSPVKNEDLLKRWLEPRFLIIDNFVWSAANEYFQFFIKSLIRARFISKRVTVFAFGSGSTDFQEFANSVATARKHIIDLGVKNG